MAMISRVTALVVSYNRSQLLRQCLDGLQAQTRKPDSIIVVDNASSDDSASVVQQHPCGAKLVQLSRNMGGAGGFSAGIALALEEGSDWDNSSIWIMDDDVIPTSTALEKLLDAAEEASRLNGRQPTVMGSQALWINGEIHGMSKPRPRTWVKAGHRTLKASAGAYQVRSLSFVSCLISAQAIRKARALPRSAYFLWNDDFEFTTRLLKDGIGYFVPASEVVHKTKVFGSSDADPGNRFFYEVRNKIWLMRYSSSNFTVMEFGELLAKTVRRWVLTLLRSKDRGLILKCLGRGLRAGFGTRPLDNASIFCAEPEVAQAIQAVEGDGFTGHKR